MIKKQLYAIIGISFAILISICSETKGQSNSADSVRNYLHKLIESTSADDKKTLLLTLKKLGRSDQEKDMAIAIDYFQWLKEQKTADSLIDEVVRKFPEGKRARDKSVMEGIYPLKTALSKENAYYVWIKKFPPSKFVNDDIIYEYVVSHIASTYAKEKNLVKVAQFAAKLRQDFYKGSAYGGIGGTFKATGDLANAAFYYQKALESSKPFYESKAVDAKTLFATRGYPILAFLYSKILFEQRKYDQAVIYADITVKDSKTTAKAGLHYAKILMALNRNEEAYSKLEEIVKSGKADIEEVQEFKKLYIKVKGSDAGFDVYAAEIRKGVIANLQQKLKNEMIKTVAPGFTLTDLNGKEVSLSSLKGKVVVLDFWATWCGPCKASFPAMQMAVDKYKQDPNVKFFFIHTWERSPTPVKDAAEFISAQKYDFEVLMDTADPETKKNKVVSDYDVKGIPAKFVIDPAGNIRFRFMGFDGNKEAAVDEVSLMIDLAKAAI